jgi:pimeloyl-ACP methyl ester carboxylesterase
MPRFTSGDVRIAFDIVGTGAMPVVVTPGWVSHLDYDWSTPDIRGYYEQLAGTSRRVIRYDKRGNGLSDRPAGVDAYSLDAQVGDLLAVYDAAGLSRAALLGWSQGGPIALAFAARYPARVSHLVLGAIVGTVSIPEFFAAPGGAA